MKSLAKYFIHPEDRAAQDQLEAIPLFPQCVKAFLKLWPERSLHGLNMAEKIRLGPQQLPKVYRFLPPAVEALGIAEPEFYLEMNPAPNAYTMGDSQIAVTVTSGLIQHMEDDEIQAVVAHECGHIACRHTLYRTMAMMLFRLGLGIFGPLAAVAMPVQLALLYWMRRSELSADRAGAFMMRDPQSMMEAMVRLSGGPIEITGEINFELYMQQAEAYDQLLESQWDKMLQNLAVMQRSHPFNAVRCRELKKWCDGEQFQRLMAGLHESAGGPHCPSCGKVVRASWQFCGGCGRRVEIQTSGE